MKFMAKATFRILFSYPLRAALAHTYWSTAGVGIVRARSHASPKCCLIYFCLFAHVFHEIVVCRKYSGVWKALGTNKNMIITYLRYRQYSFAADAKKKNLHTFVAYKSISLHFYFLSIFERLYHTPKHREFENMWLVL